MNSEITQPHKICITGTKGKTTVTAVISEVLEQYYETVLKVDTKGHYINGVQKGTMEESKAIWGLVPSVSPGRFLYELIGKETSSVAVLESSLGSSTLSGLGYFSHQVGIFLNVYEDHMGSTDRLKTKRDIMKAKRFVFERLSGQGGVAVFNADDELVVEALKFIPSHVKAKIIPFGLGFAYFDLNKHLASGGSAITIKNNQLLLLTEKKEIKVLDVRDVSWTFNANFKPSLYNLMAVFAGLIGLVGGSGVSKIGSLLTVTKLDPYGGRLTLMKSAKGTQIIADYAHEKYSLREVSKLAKNMINNMGKVIGVVRLAYDRTDQSITDTGEFIANDYDKFIVYEKIDGYWRMPKERLRSKHFPKQVVGHVSQVLFNTIVAVNPNTERILREDQAIARAAEIASGEDIVVIIVNDDIERSINFIKDSFKAEFV